MSNLKDDPRFQFTARPMLQAMFSGRWTIVDGNRDIVAMDLAPEAARLFAAAPDLYDACQRIAGFSPLDSIGEDPITKAKAALAKANINL